MADKLYLILENGAVFEGESFGAKGEATGKLVFSTGMVGYIETLTDPSCYGQIVLQTFPLIGNYGVIEKDFESDASYLSAYIVRQVCQSPSNFRCEGDLDTFLKQKGIIGLCGIDTRAVTKILRKHGSMNARISTKPELTVVEQLELKNFAADNAVNTVSCKASYTVMPDKEQKHHVVLWDFGTKKSTIKALTDRGCKVTVMPSTATAEQILNEKPDGIVLSEGPGDPAKNTQIIAEIEALATKNIPIFGIGLGHQLLALSQGARTTSLLCGHHGANVPVLDKLTGKVYISTQHHEYAVDTNSLPDGAVLRFENSNDKSCEGIDYENIPCFSVQFAPSLFKCAEDKDFLFDRFISLMEGGRR